MTEDRLASLKAVFAGRTFVDQADMAPFLTDWRGLWRGDAIAVVQPQTVQEVAAIMRWASETGTPVTPQGGNTGLSGGSVPESGSRGIVMSLTRMNRIRRVDTINNSMTVEAGCLLAQVQDAADQAGRLFPLSLAAEGSCTIGGNLATNAGGTGVLRYGNARDLCLGLEVVTANGQIWNGLRGLRKDNSGYSLRDLFVGSEGTLGIITAAVVKLFPRPAAQVTAFAAVESPAAALALLEMMQSRASDRLTAFELISDICLDLVFDHVPGTRLPVSQPAPWYVLAEVSDPLSDEAATETLQGALMEAFEAGVVLDVAIASSIAQSQDFWALREHVSEAQGAAGKTVKHDVSVPISDIGLFITEATTALMRLHPDVRPVIFGHLGDGNLHYNISPAIGGDGEALLARQGEINRIIHDIVVAHGGSISAEHGLGVLRRDEAAHYKAPVETSLMRAIKHALDPAGILNPGKLIAQ
ncbi:FAD-binding oxidoreductase [Sphingobium sp. Cam5-1]|uniref:FAD-binding oxidoreductase n=1 Tax=Sphingobium sp. Cam5-1 TaxID=2789327 RepID=UPI0018AD21C0|nr:FAD-binding oxidoreductase [Sphingobium sp. Cam5-1]QPI74634.1 FAD-binding oxidoreductase [Sphingobium sp. Cam5-1]